MRAPATDLPIVLHDMSVRVGPLTILDRISLQFAAGPPTLLIGPNGSGKTMLIRVAMGLRAPNSGSVTWAGRAHSTGERRAMVFQRPVMLRRTAAGNVAYALADRRMTRAERLARVDALLHQVGLADR